MPTMIATSAAEWLPRGTSPGVAYGFIDGNGAACGAGVCGLLAWWTSVILAANAVLTRLSPALKRRLVSVVARYVINPPVRVLVGLGVLPLGFALLETTGRRSGRPRRTPVGDGLVADTFWIVAEHGQEANYVRNLLANPRVRVKVRSGLRPRWREGVATVLAEDDPHARQRVLSRRHPLRALNAAVVRVMGTDLLTIRIDLVEPGSGRA